MVGFILMIDPFTSENGATRFVPGSHLFSYSPKDVMEDTTGFCKGEKLATGPAGSMIVYNGSVWHGFTANRSEKARRSIQGAYIARDETGWFDGRSARIGPETLARISPLAKYLLNTEQAAKS